MSQEQNSRKTKRGKNKSKAQSQIRYVQKETAKEQEENQELKFEDIIELIDKANNNNPEQDNKNTTKENGQKRSKKVQSEKPKIPKSPTFKQNSQKSVVYRVKNESQVENADSTKEESSVIQKEAGQSHSTNNTEKNNNLRKSQNSGKMITRYVPKDSLISKNNNTNSINDNESDRNSYKISNSYSNNMEASRNKTISNGTHTPSDFQSPKFMDKKNLKKSFTYQPKSLQSSTQKQEQESQKQDNRKNQVHKSAQDNIPTTKKQQEKKEQKVLYRVKSPQPSVPHSQQSLDSQELKSSKSLNPQKAKKQEKNNSKQQKQQQFKYVPKSQSQISEKSITNSETKSSARQRQQQQEEQREKIPNDADLYASLVCTDSSINQSQEISQKMDALQLLHQEKREKELSQKQTQSQKQKDQSGVQQESQQLNENSKISENTIGGSLVKTQIITPEQIEAGDYPELESPDNQSKQSININSSLKENLTDLVEIKEPETIDVQEDINQNTQKQAIHQSPEQPKTEEKTEIQEKPTQESQEIKEIKTEQQNEEDEEQKEEEVVAVVLSLQERIDRAVESFLQDQYQDVIQILEKYQPVLNQFNSEEIQELKEQDQKSTMIMVYRIYMISLLNQKKYSESLLICDELTNLHENIGFEYLVKVQLLQSLNRDLEAVHFLESTLIPQDNSSFNYKSEELSDKLSELYQSLYHRTQEFIDSKQIITPTQENILTTQLAEPNDQEQANIIIPAASGAMSGTIGYLLGKQLNKNNKTSLFLATLSGLVGFGAVYSLYNRQNKNLKNKNKSN